MVTAGRSNSVIHKLHRNQTYIHNQNERVTWEILQQAKKDTQPNEAIGKLIDLGPTPNDPEAIIP